MTHFEPGKVRGKPCIDPGGVLTVCDGQTGRGIDPKRIYTDAECDAWRESDLAEADAGNPVSSTMRRKFNAGDYAGGCAELDRWLKGRVDGVLVAMPGLVTRRG